MIKNIYFIGGSPCGGKSTVAEALSKKYDLYYFKVDDLLDQYIQMGASKGYEICSKLAVMNSEQIWMRDPALQCKEELLFYEEVCNFWVDDLYQVTTQRGIITEGAAYFPILMKKLQVPYNRYISITPTAEFQVFHFKKREWVPYILEGCSDKEAAFSKWMERDILFAEDVRKQCEKLQYLSLTNNGEMTIEEMITRTAVHFGLEAQHEVTGK